MRYIFFGTPEIAVSSLRSLCDAGHVPALVVTQPDRPAGRGNVLTPPPVKVFALERGIEVVQIEKVTEDFIEFLQKRAGEAGVLASLWDCFVLVAFGMILPQKLLNIPRMGTLNMHPSLLPRLRGPSPIRTSILTNQRDAVGVTVMLIDEKMDHGPILAQRPIGDSLPTWPMYGRELDVLLADAGGALLAETLPRYIAGEIQPETQDHAAATYCAFIEKKDAQIDLADDPYTTMCKICAYDGWPGAFTFVDKKDGTQVRVKITKAHLADSATRLCIDECVPEGKKPMLWTDFLRGL